MLQLHTTVYIDTSYTNKKKSGLLCYCNDFRIKQLLKIIPIAGAHTVWEFEVDISLKLNVDVLLYA